MRRLRAAMLLAGALALAAALAATDRAAGQGPTRSARTWSS